MERFHEIHKRGDIMDCSKFSLQELEWMHEAIIKELAISDDLDVNGYHGNLNRRLEEVKKEINYRKNGFRNKIKKDCNFH